MKKRLISMLLVFVLVLSMLGGAFTVSAASNYYITNAEELKQFALDVNAGKDFTQYKVVLTEDIILNENLVDSEGNLLRTDAEEWIPIGTSEHPFVGVFDGKGHTVSGLYISGTKESNKALFGVVSKTTIYNIIVKDSYVSGYSEVGAVMGYAKDDSMITNCHNYNTTVYAEYQRAGGVVGQVHYSNVFNCSNYGYIKAGSRCTGGICGDNYRNGKIYNCANYGIVEGRSLVGGISGGTTSADIENCLNAGELRGSDRYLIAGGAGDRDIDNCYALKNENHNPNINISSSRVEGCSTFSDVDAVLDTPVMVNGRECTTARQALNAWQTGRTDNIAYQDWYQHDGLPYLELDLIPSILVLTEETFEDVKPEDWYYDEVKYVYDNGLMNGTTNDTFGPNLETSRGMVVTILFRQEGEPAASRCDFKDVYSGQWYTDAVNWAAEEGIVKGFTDGTFRPNQAITRQELSAIIYRYSEYKGYDVTARQSLDSFPDGGQTGSWAVENVRWAVAEGLLSGKTGGLLAPTADASRAEVATVLTRYCTNLVDKA